MLVPNINLRLSRLRRACINIPIHITAQLTGIEKAQRSRISSKTIVAVTGMQVYNVPQNNGHERSFCLRPWRYYAGYYWHERPGNDAMYRITREPVARQMYHWTGVAVIRVNILYAGDILPAEELSDLRRLASRVVQEINSLLPRQTAREQATLRAGRLDITARLTSRITEIEKFDLRPQATRMVPLTPAARRAMILSLYRGVEIDSLDFDARSCSICFEDYKAPDVLPRQATCCNPQTFCESCVLESLPLSKKCPMCRRDYSRKFSQPSA